MNAGTMPGAPGAPSTEQTIDQDIDFAAQIAKGFGFGAYASAAEPLALMGVHLGIGIAHIIKAIHHAQHVQQIASPAQAPTLPAGQPANAGEPSS